MQLRELKAVVSSKVRLTVLITGSTENGWYMTFWVGSLGLDHDAPRFCLETSRGDWKNYKTIESCLSDLRKTGLDISDSMACKLLLNPSA